MSWLPEWLTSVMIDTCCFIHHLQPDEHPAEAAYVEELLRRVEQGRLSALTSPITLAEIMAKPRRHGLDDVAYAYKLLLLNFPNLRIPPIDVAIADKASMLRGRFGLKLPDALQVATGIVYGASAFITFDREIRRAAPVITVIIPGE